MKINDDQVIIEILDEEDQQAFDTAPVTSGHGQQFIRDDQQALRELASVEEQQPAEKVRQAPEKTSNEKEHNAEAEKLEEDPFAGPRFRDFQCLERAAIWLRTFRGIRENSDWVSKLSCRERCLRLCASTISRRIHGQNLYDSSA